MANKGDYLDSAVERISISRRGWPGASVERVVLADGRRLVVRRVTPTEDLRMAMTGDAVGREYAVWSRGILDQLPVPVSHAVVDGWLEPDAVVIVMDDLGDAMLGPPRRLSRADCGFVLKALGTMYQEFLGRAPTGLTALALLLTQFAPQRMRLYVGCGNDLPDVVLQGWEAFDDVVAEDMSSAVFALLADPGPVVEGLMARPCTMIHGGLETDNMAIRNGKLTLVDWTVTGVAPAAVDIAWMLARSSSMLDLSREDVLAEFGGCAGPAADDVATRLALLAGLVAFGWRKALDATQHPDLARRERAWADLDWWVREARCTLESALI